MRCDPESAALMHETFAAVRERARGRCESCGVVGGEPESMIEGVPSPDDTLLLCAACSPVLGAELSRRLDYRQVIAEIVRRAADRG